MYVIQTLIDLIVSVALAALLVVTAFGSISLVEVALCAVYILTILYVTAADVARTANTLMVRARMDATEKRLVVAGLVVAIVLNVLCAKYIAPVQPVVYNMEPVVVAVTKAELLRLRVEKSFEAKLADVTARIDL